MISHVMPEEDTRHDRMRFAIEEADGEGVKAASSPEENDEGSIEDSCPIYQGRTIQKKGLIRCRP